MENNDNNLFTNMFGIESEEQPISQPQPPTPQQEPVPQPAVLEPQPVAQQAPVEQTIKPSIQIEQPIVEEIIVLDSNPKPIEQPVEQTIEEPTLNSINSVSKELPSSEPIYEETSISQENIYKPVCIILGITLLVVVLAFPLYNVVNNYLHTTAQQEKNNAEPTPQEEQPKEEQPQTPVLNIEFDLDLSFDKGYTTNKNEYQRTSSFKPESSEGVVKCEVKNPIIHQDGINNTALYFYYKDFMVKKILTLDDMTLRSASIYNQYISNLQSIISITASNEHLFTRVLVDEDEYRIKYLMMADLAYSQAVRIPDSDYYLDITVSYNTPIQSAMNKMLGNKDYIGNSYCSTINTQDASI